MSVWTSEPIVQRARAEYLEMPGLCLTEPQARRLWHLDQAACRTVLATLVDGGFLRRTWQGAYVRADIESPADSHDRRSRAFDGR